ncbi:aminoglycoside phosphotransferase [Amycolatopsis dendrobii]|uniref:Aminoglycoside phosphotransferase n=1 Tax=Amycolatopsis dendrobii TaxID=2760662 RepID=A0A7W3ZA53_9PSEU|nr:aminoglycoside phosphotransferase [Amycolatopsis dendrobii]MBB1153537.1 aminoglycoside phosphotransferase [Amycolatopsis dendrobii]
MSTDAEEIEKAVEERRVWLGKQLDVAAMTFDVSLIGQPVNTFDMRSAGAVAHDESDADVWLRVVVEDPDYEPACRWDGNLAANSILGVAKPTVLRCRDWRNSGEYLRDRRLRGEVMTLAPGTTVAPDGVLRDDPLLPETWWDELRQSLAALAEHPLEWHNELGAVNYTIRGVREHFGITLSPEVFTDVEWTTAHADLHWGNLRKPQLCILDWESWRPAFAGYDLATLYCNSLLHPPTARRIRDMPELQTRSGRLALLSAICRYLSIMGSGSDWDLLDDYLRAEAETLLPKL